VVGLHSFRVEPGRSIRLWRTRNELAHRKRYFSDVIIASELVPVQNSELDFECLLVLANMEQQLFFPLRIQRVADDTSSENLLAKRYNHEWVHVPHHAGH
jgi:hypothetical protein